jgi:hypothetical protein
MTDLALPPDLTPAPTTLFASDDPAVVVQRATRIAEVIAPLIRQQNLVKRIGQSEHVYVEAWALAGSMLGVFATTVRTWEIGDDQGYGATVEARTLAGAVVGRADAVVMRSEEVGGKRKWEFAPAFQLISMAQTRGSSKSLRMPLGFVMKLAGYETTPAEEMEAAAARGETVSGGRGVRPGWRDIAEQQRAHAEVGTLIDNLGARQWVAEWLQSKGYERPLAKAQLSQLRRAIEREFEQSDGSDQTSGVGDGAGRGATQPPHSPARPTPDPTSSGAAARGVGRIAVPEDPTPTSPSALEQEEASELARSRAEGANHHDPTKPGAGSRPGVATPPGPSPPGPGGTNSPAGSAAKGARPETSVRGRQGKQGESHGSAAGRAPTTDEGEPPGWER